MKQILDFSDGATRPSGVSVICHSSVSLGKRFKNNAITSGTVALRDLDFGRAIEVFDLRLTPFSMYIDSYYSQKKHALSSWFSLSSSKVNQ